MLSGATLSGQGALFDTKTFDGVKLGMGAASGKISWNHSPMSIAQHRFLSFEVNSTGSGMFMELKNTDNSTIHDVSRLLLEIPGTGGAFQILSMDLADALTAANDAIVSISFSDLSGPATVRNVAYSNTPRTNATAMKFDLRRYTQAAGAWAMPTPFLDLLPAMNFVSPAGFAYGQGRWLSPGVTPASAVFPARLRGQFVGVDLRTSPHLAFLYSSSMQYFIDIELKNRLPDGSEVTLAKNLDVATQPKLRVTLPSTGGLAALANVDLTPSLVPGLNDYSVSSITLSDISLTYSDLKLLGLGFTSEASPSASRLSVAFDGTAPHIFFYNGCLNSSDDFVRWKGQPGTRWDFSAKDVGPSFFRTTEALVPSVPQLVDGKSFSFKPPTAYVNYTVTSGFQLIANPLYAANNTLSGLVLGIPAASREGLVLMKIGEPCIFQDPRGQAALDSFAQLAGIPKNDISVNVFAGGQWTNPDQILAPGEGAILYNPSTSFVMTYVGAVLEGTILNFIPAGLSLRSGIVPQRDLISAAHLFVPSPGDSVSFLIDGAIKSYVYSGAQGWSPNEPTVVYGQSFFVHAANPFVWRREFTVH